MTKINESIENFKLNQEILGREKRYVDLFMFRLYIVQMEKVYGLKSWVRLSRSRINKILKELCNNAGVRKEVRCSPRDCRHQEAK